jgi:hypothetical protein
MKIARSLLVLVSVATIATGQEDAQLAATVEALPTQIEAVASGGYWSRGKVDGSFRLVVEVLGWDDLYSRAFVQWIRTDPDKQDTIVERTVRIKEISGRWRVVSQRFVLGGKQTHIVISAERRSPLGKATFTVTPSADFSYTIATSEK